jgi:hypothetical protein
MVTFFTTFEKFGQGQMNALRSWREMYNPPADIIVMQLSDNSDDTEILWPNVRREIVDGTFGRPRVDRMFALADELAHTEIKCYVNADIVLLPDFAHALDVVSGEFGTFLMIGRRWDIDDIGEINFRDPIWYADVGRRAHTNGRLHATSGMDYFAWRGNVWDNIPPFAIGCYAWDTWLAWAALNVHIPVVDATPLATAVHQDHPTHNRREDPAALNNLDLLASGTVGNDWRERLVGTQHATFELTTDGRIARR